MTMPTTLELRQAYSILDRYHETTARHADWVALDLAKKSLADEILRRETR